MEFTGSTFITKIIKVVTKTGLLLFSVKDSSQVRVVAEQRLQAVSMNLTSSSMQTTLLMMKVVGSTIVSFVDVLRIVDVVNTTATYMWHAVQVY